MPETSLRNKALDFLARREFTVKELRFKLKKYSPDPSEIETVIQDLVKSNLLSDERYSEALIQQKYQNGYGPNHIKMYLDEKGVSAEIYDLNNEELDWVLSCKEQAKKKLRGKPLAGKEKEKILRFLSYRGFNYEIIKLALTDID